MWLAAMRQLIKELGTATAFKQDPFGYSQNFVAHIGVGIAGTWLLSIVIFFLGGEFPYRWQLFAAIATLYAAKEIIFDRWHGFDTVEDFITVAIYGAGATVYSHREILPGSSQIVFDAFAALPFFIVATVHLIIGVLYRSKGDGNG